MRFIKYIAILSLLIQSIYASSNRCTSSDIGFEIGIQRGSLDGFIKSGSDLNSTNIDIKKDLDLTDSINSLKAILQKGYKNHKFGFNISRFKVSGKKRLTSDLIFNSEYFAKSTIVKSKLDLRWLKANYRYTISDELSIGADINAIRMYNYINDNSKREIFVMPSLAVDYNIHLADDLLLITKASLTPFGTNRYTSGYAGVAYRVGLSKCSYLHIGYQVSQFILDKNDLNANLSYHGAYAGIKFKF